LKFQRITSSGRYSPEIDGIRFIAIFAVFVFHLAGDVLRHAEPGYGERLASDPLFRITQVLNIGVQLFFVLSGYVLALPFASQYQHGGRTVSLKRYFLRRLTRLEPPYIVSLILLFLLKILTGRSSFAALWPHLAASLGYVHNLVYGQPSDVNFVAWSLEIEVQFYLLAPLLSFLLFRTESAWKRRATIAACCVAAGAAASLVSDWPRMSLTLIGQAPYFLAGFLLADVESAQVEGKSRGRWDVVSIGAFLLLFSCIRASWLLYVGPLTIATAYWAAFRSLWVRQFLRMGFISAVGGMCYTIYLLHNYVIAIGGQFTERFSATFPFALRLAAQGVILGAAVLVVSSAFYLLIERPCMRPDWPAQLTKWAKSKVGRGYHLAPVVNDELPVGKRVES
jgi:peptidoglycan/LPS O-acetylase OafA/YrhL